MSKSLSMFLVLSLLMSTCAAVKPSPTSPPLSPPAASPTPPPTPAARVLVRAGEGRGTPSGLPADREEGVPADGTAETAERKQAIQALPRVGSLAPDFTLRALDGTTVTLSALRGRPVLINFWTSWCAGCRQEAPELQKLYDEFRGQRLVILGLNVTTQDSLKEVRAYVDEFKLTFTIPLDEQETVTRDYRVPGLPASFFIDRDGVIRDVILGQMNRQTMQEGLELTKPW